MNDYQRMARVIRHLGENFTGQPTLAELAAFAGMSPSHFHRRFSQWTGVSPKDFVQCLTLEDAAGRLAAGRSVLDASLGAGLSGPGRLHDLTVSLEAATPGEVKSGGEGLEVTWGLAETPFGRCLLGQTGRGVCHLSFLEDDDRRGTAALGRLRARWPAARTTRSDRVAEEVLAGVFTAVGPGTLRTWVSGTAFQLRVWRALLQIPPGMVASYGALARAIGQPGAARALGSAVGANPVAVLIPCHRVIRETGAIGGYRWGTPVKHGLLAWEAAGGGAAV